MRKLLSFAFFFIFFSAFSQNKSDIGILAGSSFYLGDINQSRLFYSPQFNGGLNCRVNLNSRYVIKASINYVGLSANDADFSNTYQQIRNGHMNVNLYDANIQFEFNFLPYKFAKRKIGFTPFVSAGFGGTYIMGSNYEQTIHPALPYAIGMKFALGKRWSTGWEWTFSKTFFDEMDDISNIGGGKSLFHNNDYFSYAGLFIAFKIFDSGSDCDAYEKERKQ